MTIMERWGIVGGKLTKRAGMIVDRNVRRYGEPDAYTWGERETEPERAICETCEKVIAIEIDWSELKELAEACEATLTEAGWECAECRDKRYAEGEKIAREYGMQLRREIWNSEASYSNAVDDMLDAADQMRKARRENPEG